MMRISPPTLYMVQIQNNKCVYTMFEDTKEIQSGYTATFSVPGEKLTGRLSLNISFQNSSITEKMGDGSVSTERLDCSF
jgi:hypothetical protein